MKKGIGRLPTKPWPMPSMAPHGGWRRHSVDQTFETLAYIGPNDLRYNVLILGAVKAGYKVSLMSDTRGSKGCLPRLNYQMLVTSPRNSIPAHVNLFNLLDCTVLLIPHPPSPMISALTAAHKLHVA